MFTLVEPRDPVCASSVTAALRQCKTHLKLEEEEEEERKHLRGSQDYVKAEIYFQFDFENRIHGANFLAYPPVVAGGNRANTLHYISNNQIIKVRQKL